VPCRLMSHGQGDRGPNGAAPAAGSRSGGNADEQERGLGRHSTHGHGDGEPGRGQTCHRGAAPVVAGGEASPCRAVYCVTVRVTAALATPPTVTTTGCGPNGASGGIMKLICVTPTDQVGMPMNRNGVSAGTGPTVTAT